MPFPSSGTYPLSNKDVVSFTFDDPSYDVDRPIFSDPEDPSKYYSHRSAKDLVCRLIAGLKAAGLQPKDTVCIHSFNSLVYPLLVLAIIGAGGLSVGTNPSYTGHELNHAIQVARVRFVLAEPEILPDMMAALKENNIDVGKRLFVLDAQPGQSPPLAVQSWRLLLGRGSSDWIRFNDESTAANTAAQLYYSSGTTGLPKCAVTTHRNLVAQHQLYFEANPRPHPFRVALTMPFFHVGIAPLTIVSVIKQGKEAYVMRRFELLAYLRYHTKFQLTEMFTVPPMIVGIVGSGLADPASTNYRKDCSLKSVRNGSVGAAPCSGDMQQRFTALLGEGATFGQVWGMTETTCIGAYASFDVSRKCASGELKAWGNVGRPIRCLEAKLIDEDGKDVTESGKGQFCVKGPIVVPGYFENDKATKESWDAEGFFMTGDVVQVDENGLMFVVERVKELIKVRGFQVAPAELEGVLTEHPDIVDAAVIGVRANQDEAPKAYLVRRPGSSLQAQDVVRHMQERLARYKQLHGGIEFVDNIPKLPSGKILKRVLREQARKGHGGPGPKI